jgi:HNH endonuclease
LEYYWPLEVKYHIRQGIDPDKDPIVMKLVRRLVGTGAIVQGEMLTDFKRRMPEEHKMLLAAVAREAFDDVIPRFHIVHAAAIAPTIFTFTGTVGRAGDIIELTNRSRQFLIDYKKLIDYVAISGWARFTERFTSAPRLHDKIGGSNLTRGAVWHWRGPLMAIQSGKCFYDHSHDMASAEVDHILPWSFVLEDKTWNLVLACRKCNNEKRDQLANLDALQRLCARNEQIASRHIGTDPAFLRHFAEWHSRDLSSHIRGLYDQAVADGFPMWK